MCKKAGLKCSYSLYCSDNIYATVVKDLHAVLLGTTTIVYQLAIKKVLLK